MKVYCTLKTLKEAWALLKEIGVAEMISGESLKVNISELLDKLLSADKLNGFLQIITKSDRDFSDDDIADIGSAVTDFFGLIGSSFKGLNLQGKAAAATEASQD
jgi:hypothetical protein